MRTANAVAIAGGAVTVALMDWMIKAKFLATDGARAILTDAQTRLRPFETTTAPGAGPASNPIINTDVVEAQRIIGELFRGLT